ncbi:hypothetical protein FHS77_000235 [Paenochrobactrum gallinarii]|uniref:DUF4398 domain-containing protein n=1 Tax=Paenochrobactrum gallinarii TaxID=643673 RepID=A0A841LTB3_9HYPH|nr:hypothetical protein [Paenochrobactrum gallinarii]
MTVHFRQPSRFTLGLAAVAMIAVLGGCAGGAEFQGTPQEGARRTGVYPNFGHMPQAATSQITAQEKDDATTALDAERKRLKSVKGDAPLTAAQLAELRRQAQAEANATLQAIENSN